MWPFEFSTDCIHAEKKILIKAQNRCDEKCKSNKKYFIHLGYKKNKKMISVRIPSIRFSFLNFFFQTCSQLIKAGLKLSLEMKRKLSSGDSSGTEYNKIAKKEYLDSSDDDDDMDSKSPRCGVI